jgi:hypothetical protein
VLLTALTLNPFILDGGVLSELLAEREGEAEDIFSVFSDRDRDRDRDRDGDGDGDGDGPLLVSTPVSTPVPLLTDVCWARCDWSSATGSFCAPRLFESSRAKIWDNGITDP